MTAVCAHDRCVAEVVGWNAHGDEIASALEERLLNAEVPR